MLIWTDVPCLHVPGVGDIDQYGGYYDRRFELGAIYFIRDSTERDMRRLGELPHLLARWYKLNAEIAQWEAQRRVGDEIPGPNDTC